MNLPTWFRALLLVLLPVLAGCSTVDRESDLYVLEELERASGLEDPQERLERLEIFVKNHATHPYRLLGYKRMKDAYIKDLHDGAGFEKALANALSRENHDPKLRGMLHLTKFEYLFDEDKIKSYEYAEKLLSADETNPRLYLYMGYSAMDGNPELSGRCFERVVGLAGENRYMRAVALASIGSLLEREGRIEDALEAYKSAVESPFANEAIGRLLWERGEWRDAIDAYLRFVAGVPAAREETRLDSLYAIVYPSSDDLDERLTAMMIGDFGELPDRTFVDMNGREHRLGDYRGKAVMVNIWQPT